MVLDADPAQRNHDVTDEGITAGLTEWWRELVARRRGHTAMSAQTGGEPMGQFQVHVAARIEFRFYIEAPTSGDAGIAAQNRARAALSDAAGSPLWALTEIRIHRVPEEQ